MYSAILFDMDGVVADTKGFVTRFWQELASARGFMLTEEQLEGHVYGRTAEHTIQTLFPMVTPPEWARIRRVLRDYEVSLTYVEVAGATSLLRSLTRHGVPLALVTGAEPWKVDAVLAQLGLVDTFVARVHAGDVRLGKPDPSSYLLAASRVGAAPERCVVFEDAVTGIEAAVRARTTCVAVGPLDSAPELLGAGAVVVIDNFLDVEVEASSSPLSGNSRLVIHVTPEVDLTVGA